MGGIASAVGIDLDGIGSAFNELVSFVGRPFGMYDHEELVTGIQVSNLLTPEVADKGGKVGARRSSRGSAVTYFHGYRHFQREYRRKYSKQFMQSLGYAPSSTATTYTITEAKTKAWLASNYGYLDVTLASYGDKYLTSDDMISYSKQNTVGYNPDTGKLVEGGKTYGFVLGTIVNPTTVSMLWRREYEEAITQNLVDNYSYDYVNHTVVIGGLVYGLGPFSPEIVNDNYHITAVRTGSPDVVIATPVEELTRWYANYLFDNGVLWIAYSVVDGGVYEYVGARDPYTVVYPGGLTDTVVPVGYYVLVSGVGTGTRYVMAPARSLPVYDTVAIDITAIIPMKENNNMVDLDGEKLVRMLKKLNLSGEQLKANIENPDIDAAYLLTGVDIRINNNSHNKVLFQMFDMISPTQGNINIGISQLQMSYLFHITKNEYPGVVGAVGEYSRVMQNYTYDAGYNADGYPTTGTDTRLILRYQGSSNNYKELVITNFTQQYTVQGTRFTTLLDATTGYTRLLIPLSIYNDLPYKDWVDVYENSLCFLAYSEKVVFVRWYESGFFAFVLKVIAIVVTIIAFIPSGGTSIAWGSVILAMIESYVIALVIIEIGKAIGGPLGLALAVAATVYISMKNPGAGAQKTGTMAWLKPASDGLSVINQAIQHELQNAAANYEEWLKNAQEMYDQLKEKIDEMNKDSADNVIMGYGQFSDTLGTANSIFLGTEDYVKSIVNTEALVDGRWMYDIDSQIARRNTVIMGR